MQLVGSCANMAMMFRHAFICTWLPQAIEATAAVQGEAGKSPLSNGQKGGRVPEDTGEKPQECKQQ